MISSTVNRMQYAGAGSTGPYPFTFRIFAATDLVVTKRSVTGVETALVYLTDFVLTAGTTVGDGAGGNITLTVALATGEVLTIRRVVPLTQPVSLANQAAYFGATHETEFDRIVAQVQQLDDRLRRSIGLKETFDPASYALLVGAPVTGKVLVGTGSGVDWAALDANAVALPPGGRTVTTLSAYLANNAVYNTKDFGAVGDGASHPLSGFYATLAAAQVVYPHATALTNEIDWAAIQKAINALPAQGGRIDGADGVFLCDQPLNSAGKVGVTIIGRNAATASSSASKLLYTGSGTRFIDARSTVGFILQDVQVAANNAAFAGDLVDLSHTGVGAIDATLWGFYRVLFSGLGPAASLRSAILMEDAVIGIVQRCNFANMPVAILGRVTNNTHYANAIEISGNHFSATIGTIPIRNPGQAWDVRNNTFEGVNTSAAAGAVDFSAGFTANGLVYQDNWHGDTPVVGTWVQFAGNGLVAGGNYFGSGLKAYSIKSAAQAISIGSDDFSQMAAGASAIELLGACSGLSIRGNSFGSAMTTPIIGLYSFGHTWVDVDANTGTFAPAPYTNSTSTAVVGSAALRSVMGNGQFHAAQNSAANAFRRLLGLDNTNTVQIAADGDPVNVGGPLTAKQPLVSSNSGTQATIAAAATFTIAGIPSRRVVLVSIAHNADPNKGRLVMYQHDGVGVGVVTAIADSTAGGIGIAATAPGTLTITNGSGGNSGYAWSYAAMTGAV